jgi:hypothetical protein
VGAAGKFKPPPGGKGTELKKEKPGQQLGFPAIGMTERDNAPALPGQRPLKRMYQRVLSPQNRFCDSVKKKEVEADKNPDNEYYRF